MKLVVLALVLAAVSCARGGETAGGNASPAAASPQAPQTPPPQQQRAPLQSFRGFIGDGLAVRAQLRREGESVSGTYFYESVKTEIALRGRVDNQGEFTLEEFDPSGARTGVFRGRWGSDDTGAAELQGNWSRPDGSRSMPFTLTEVPVEFASDLRLGSKEIREKKARPRYEIAVEYPQLEGGAAAGEAAAGFNRAAREWATKAVGEFKADVQEAGEAAGTEQASDLHVSYGVGVATDDLVAVQFEVSNYFSGAAHPNHHTAVINYDLRRARRLQLADLFKPSALYLRALSEYCVRDLKRQSRGDGTAEPMLTDEAIEEGAAPNADNYSSWLVTRRGLQITFDPYQVGPYAAGPQRVLVPYAALREHIDLDGPLAPFVK
jgi:hypothetical protein